MSNSKRQITSQGASPAFEQVKPGSNAGTADLLIAGQPSQSPMFDAALMEEICQRSNLLPALKRVMQNQGAPGVDGMTVEELPNYLKAHWLDIKERLLHGVYRPQPVRKVAIPKLNGMGVRQLCIPTVLDRLIQQATLQVLQAKWDRSFSEHSYGFRPRRSAHQAVAQAQSYLKAGYEWVVDLDLEKFFDRVNHDRLLSVLAQRISDARVLQLIRAYLKAGVLENGLVSPRHEGAAQGGPLSPFLSNVVLDELDKELERRGHQFVRYGDDCNIYVCSQRAGERVMASISRFITHRLKLKINQSKSAVARPHERKFLGFSFTASGGLHRRKVANEAIRRFKQRVRQLTRRTRSVNWQERIAELSQYLRGWKAYFEFAETIRQFKDLDSWIRRRLRCALWKQWKTYRRRKRELIALGVPPLLAHTTAWSNKGPWRICHTPGVQLALSNDYFNRQGLPKLND
ncbi:MULTISPECIES: group II intron reverse transcriptase/maturase [Trichocoleus]|uniref:Group II intron reverse transcriptase/maturase n=1 Tax=Trichocoleus desertorum GB2-A4 TaxID=2933944 RepID=A0ABV0JER3_9CYAN|nr:group II intron reverse transcriptase/maturase [Trichocoleus sp. FACHB-46]